MENKFCADPYNFNNKLIEKSDVINIMKKLNINDFNINDIHFIKKQWYTNLIANYQNIKNLNIQVIIAYHFKKKLMKHLNF